MQLNNENQIPDIAKQTNFSIFELPKNIQLDKLFINSIHITPEGDKVKHISIEQIRNIAQITTSKQSSDLFIIIEQPELMSQNATNAFLKSLEEPGNNIHYVFLSYNADLLLPTVRSRAYNYYLPDNKKVSDAPEYSEEIIKLAKAYISSAPNTIADTVDKIIKLRKDDARNGALEVVNAGIDLMYKSYLMTGNQNFAVKLEKLLKTEDAIQQNGHLKLQLIANML